MRNDADPLRMGSGALPALTDAERDEVIRIAAEGGKVPRHRIGNAILAALLRTQVVAPVGPGTVELTSLGVRVLADAARAVTDA